MAIGLVHQGAAFVLVECLPTFGFWAITLDPHMLERQSMALKTRMMF